TIGAAIAAHATPSWYSNRNAAPGTGAPLSFPRRPKIDPAWPCIVTENPDKNVTIVHVASQYGAVLTGAARILHRANRSSTSCRLYPHNDDANHGRISCTSKLGAFKTSKTPH
ncbi:hypothetical protein DYB26_012479, partial [Aphanomyces astaci]